MHAGKDFEQEMVFMVLMRHVGGVVADEQSEIHDNSLCQHIAATQDIWGLGTYVDSTSRLLSFIHGHLQWFPVSAGLSTPVCRFRMYAM